MISVRLNVFVNVVVVVVGCSIHRCRRVARIFNTQLWCGISAILPVIASKEQIKVKFLNKMLFYHFLQFRRSGGDKER